VGTISPRRGVAALPPVHPHVRGDNLDKKTAARYTGRFTPTCVGTIGESTLPWLPIRGSPPRAWGQLSHAVSFPTIERFTPTCVGTMASTSGECGRYRGSPPRAWGQFSAPYIFRNGSPVHPHVRGDNGAEQECFRGGCRFTPTCVGTMLSQVAGSLIYFGSPPRAWGQFSPTESRIRRLTVHPHVRGDNDPEESTALHSVRFTPTCVGTICHVRSCFFSSHGSPPRAWGQFSPLPLQLLKIRFTPTCVGTIYTPESLLRPAAVHPHVRGDNTGRSQYLWYSY